MISEPAPYTAGIGALEPETPPIDPTEAPMFEMDEAGNITVTVPEDLLEGPVEEVEHFANLADTLDAEDLKAIGARVLEDFKDDEQSRSEWERMFDRGFDLLGLKIEETNDPFEGACTAVHPLIIEAAVKLQSKSSPELLPPGGPVKAQIVGEISPDVEDQAERVRAFMNYLLTEAMPEYYEESEICILQTAIIGSGFKKIYYDANEDRPVAEFVPASDFYAPYSAKSLGRADRFTHTIYRTQVALTAEIEAGMYRDITLSDPTPTVSNAMRSKLSEVLGIDQGVKDAQYRLLEQYRYEKLPGDDKAYPYIVTVEEMTGDVLSIRRNWSEDDLKRKRLLFFSHYKLVPFSGFYGLGFLHLLGNNALAATSILRSLVDAGQFANMQGGFKAKGVRVVGGNDPIGPGEFRDVEATGMDLNKSIIPLPYKEPSQTLKMMLDMIVGAGQKFADSTEQVVADSTNYGPVGTTLALLEASSKFQNAIHKRFHKAQRDEFRILTEVIKTWLPAGSYPYRVSGGNGEVLKSDFDDRVDIIPVSDPNIPSSAHRMTLAQLLLQLSSQSEPGMYNKVEIHKAILRSANLPNFERFFLQKVEPRQLDPISDIAEAVKGNPITAFPEQDHDAHVSVKSGWLQDPRNGANPLMAAAAGAIAANIRDHMVMQFASQHQGLSQQGMAPQEAAKKILAFNQAGGEVPDLEARALDLQERDLKNRQEKLGLDAAVEAAKIILKERELDLKESKIEVDSAQGMAELALEAKDARHKTILAAASTILQHHASTSKGTS